MYVFLCAGSGVTPAASATVSAKKKGRPKKKARVEEEEEAEDAGEVDEEFVISEVLQIRGKPPSLEFLIRWEGYGP